MIRHFLNIIWGILGICGAGGEAPAAEPKAADPEPSEFDGWGGEVDDEEPPEPKPPEPEPPEPEDEEEDDEDLEDVEDQDEDDDQDEDEEEDEEEEEDLASEPNILSQSWDARLMEAAQKGEGQPLRLNMNLAQVNLRDEAFQRFQEALEKDGDDTRMQAEAVFEVALDAVMQGLSQYHAVGTAPAFESVSLEARKAEVAQRMDEFLDTPEGRNYQRSAKVRKRMAEAYTAKAQKHGRRLADRIPFKDYYRMAGGKPVARGESQRRDQEDAESAKRKALGRAAPRGKSRTSGRSGSRKPRGPDAVDAIIAADKPFFSLE